MVDYRIQLDVFEGPLDLLLYLIKKEEVDIYEVNLTKIATQFIEYVEMMRRLDLDIAGEFLVMAATLMYIKSRELLPVDQQATVAAEDEEVDPRWDLIRQLVEYKKFKDAASQLQERELEQENSFARRPPKPDFEPATAPKTPVSLLDLLNAINVILKRFDLPEPSGIVTEEKWSVSEKIELLLRLMSDRPSVKFSELFAEAHSRSEIVVTFLAMLELIRLKRLAVAQQEPFGEIEISSSTPSAVPPSAESAAEATSEAVSGFQPNTLPHGT